MHSHHRKFRPIGLLIVRYIHRWTSTNRNILVTYSISALRSNLFLSMILQMAWVYLWFGLWFVPPLINRCIQLPDLIRVLVIMIIVFIDLFLVLLLVQAQHPSPMPLNDRPDWFLSLINELAVSYEAPANIMMWSFNSTINKAATLKTSAILRRYFCLQVIFNFFVHLFSEGVGGVPPIRLILISDVLRLLPVSQHLNLKFMNFFVDLFVQTEWRVLDTQVNK